MILRLPESYRRFPRLGRLTNLGHAGPSAKGRFVKIGCEGSLVLMITPLERQRQYHCWRFRTVLGEIGLGQQRTIDLRAPAPAAELHYHVNGSLTCRWFYEPGVPERLPGGAAYRTIVQACRRAWGCKAFLLCVRTQDLTPVALSPCRWLQAFTNAVMSHREWRLLNSSCSLLSKPSYSRKGRGRFQGWLDIANCIFTRRGQ